MSMGDGITRAPHACRVIRGAEEDRPASPLQVPEPVVDGHPFATRLRSSERTMGGRSRRSQGGSLGAMVVATLYLSNGMSSRAILSIGCTGYHFIHCYGGMTADLCISATGNPHHQHTGPAAPSGASANPPPSTTSRQPGCPTHLNRSSWLTAPAATAQAAPEPHSRCPPSSPPPSRSTVGRSGGGTRSTFPRPVRPPSPPALPAGSRR